MAAKAVMSSAAPSIMVSTLENWLGDQAAGPGEVAGTFRDARRG
jgi:hypothetical protein